MIFVEMTREKMIAELICDPEYLYDILDVEYVVDTLIASSANQNMIWDRQAVWEMYCEMRRLAHEERRNQEVH